MNRWTDRNGGHFCSVHNAEFPRGEVCLHCVTEPGDSLDDEAPEGVADEADLRAMQRLCETNSKRCWRVADERFDGTDKDVAAACKASAEATKWMRLALEIRDRHATQTEIETLVRKYRELLAMDGAH